MHWPVVGTLAAALTTFSFVPQLVKIVRTRSAHDISIITMAQLSLGVSLWIAYGLYIQDAIIVAANGITLVILILILIACFKFRK